MSNTLTTRRISLTPTISTRVLDTGGDGVPVVLVHGLAASIEAWRDTIPALEGKHRVVAFDLPGFGHADKPREADYTAKGFFLPMLAAFLDAMAIPRAHFVGSSMGASLVLRFAALYPERVGRIVLAAPGGFGRYIHPFMRVPTLPGLGGAMSRPMRLTNAFALRLTLNHPERRSRALLDEVDRFSKMPGAHHAFVKTLKGLTTLGGLKELDEFADDARAVTSDTLVVWGSRDKLFPVAQSEAVSDLMAMAELQIIDGAGHFPQIDTPEAFNALASEFLGRA